MIKDKELFEYIKSEEKRQRESIELIASENYVSDEVLKAMGSICTNKYAEGYPGARYYGGCKCIDKIESLAIERLKQLYGCEYANVQPHSGAQANMVVEMAVLEPGDTMLGLSLEHGGHLTHGTIMNFSGQVYTSWRYRTDPMTGLVDYDEMERVALKQHPKLIVGGASSYSREWDYERMREIADEVGAILWIDMAHTAGPIAAGLLKNPCDYADIVTSTTHKTLRGPRGGIILMKKDFPNPKREVDRHGNVKPMSAVLNSTVFPGIQGGPLEHIIAAKAVCFYEALQPEFKEYQKQVLKNAAAMADEFTRRGYKVLTDGTDNHLVLIDLRDKFPNLDGKTAAEILDRVGISLNKNTVPFDTRSSYLTSGIRLGSPAMTTRGFKEEEFRETVVLIDQALNNPTNETVLAQVRAKVKSLVKHRPLFSIY